MKNINITSKLTLAFILFAGILLVGVSIPAYLNGKASIRTATVSELVSTSLEKQSALDAWITGRQQSISDIASQQYLSGLVSSLINSSPNSTERTFNTNGIVSILNDWSGEGQNFINLQVIDSQNGQIIVSTDNTDVGKFREDQPFFIEGMKSAYIQNPYYDLTSQSPIMTASAPIILSEGKLIGVLAGRLNLGELNDIILRRTGLHQSDDVFLVNSSHFFITQPRLIPDPAVLKRGVYSVAVNACLGKNNGEIDTLDYRGIPAIIVFRWLPQQQLCLITKIDQQEAYKPIQSLGGTMILTGLIVLVLGAIGAIILSRTISKPVMQLADGTAQLSQGNLDYRIKISSTDEIGQLGMAFNQMGDAIARKDAQLRNWTEDLEQQVEKRTADLLNSENKFRTLAGRQEAILSASPDILMEVDNNKVYTWANPIGIDFFGEDVIGKEASFYFEGQQNTYNIVKPLFNGNDNVIYLESWQRRKDGVVRLLAWHCKMLKDNKGTVTGALSSAIDITNSRLAEEALLRSEIKYRTLHESMMDAFASTDLDGHIIEFNISFRELLGYSAEELYKLTYKDLTPEKWHAVEAKIIADQIMKRGYSDVYEKEYITKAKVVIPIEVRTYLIKNEKNENTGFWAIIRNISERKKAEEEILRLNENLELMVSQRTRQLLDANKELESFSYSVSHDLRAPLRALDGFSLAVLEDYESKLDDTGRNYLNRIREASQKMAQLIDAMLTLSRVTKAEINRSNVNLSNLAEKIAVELATHDPKRNVTWKIAPDLNAIADPTLIKSVMGNLLGNAWKFTSGHSRCMIEVGKLMQNGNEVFYIKDDGAGFDMKYMSKMFAPFQRLHSSSEFEGTGIGLATVNRIINKHGGRIWAEGETEKGATFYFTLG